LPAVVLPHLVALVVAHAAALAAALAVAGAAGDFQAAAGVDADFPAAVAVVDGAGADQLATRGTTSAIRTLRALRVPLPSLAEA